MNSKPIIIPELTSLRFFFMMVILAHHITSIPYMGAPPVAFFFILSGFSLSLGYREKILSGYFSYNGFIKKRFLKFYSIHWIVLLFIVIFRTIKGTMDWALFPSSFLLVQSFIPIKVFFYAFNSPSWYLCNTIFYCLLFPFIIRLYCNMSKKRKTHLLFFSLCVYIILNLIIPTAYSLSIYYINPFLRIFDFFVGICLADLYLYILGKESFMYYAKLVAVKSWYLHFIMVLLILGIIMTFTPVWELQCRSFIFWIPIGSLIFFVSIFSQMGWRSVLQSRLLVFLGKLSFPFYMFHVPIIWYINKILSILNIIQNDYTRFLATFVVTMFVSFLYNKYIEQKIINKVLIKK